MDYNFCEWIDGKWHRGKGESEWLTDEMLANLPHPVHAINQEVTFRWSGPPTLTGNISCIQMRVQEHNYFSTLPLRTTVYITAYAGGHKRWFRASAIICLDKQTACVNCGHSKESHRAVGTCTECLCADFVPEVE